MNVVYEDEDPVLPRLDKTIDAAIAEHRPIKKIVLSARESVQYREEKTLDMMKRGTYIYAGYLPMRHRCVQIELTE